MRAGHSLGRYAAVAAGLGALVFTYGCGTNASVARAQDPATGAAPAAQVVVTCEPNQRTLVRPAVVGGVAVSQVECVSIGEQPAAAPAPVVTPSPIVYRPASRLVQSARAEDLGDARIGPPRDDVSAARPVPARQVVYEAPAPERTVTRTRSVKKSAVIIGSSAGAGAGVGAAIGGKKGALIGAVVGGGGAALWDQIMRRRR